MVTYNTGSSLPLSPSAFTPLQTVSTPLRKIRPKALFDALSANVYVHSTSPTSSKPINFGSRQVPFSSQAPPSFYASRPTSTHSGGFGGVGGYRGYRGGRNRGERAFCIFCNRNGYDVTSCYYVPLNFGVSHIPASYAPFSLPRQQPNYFSQLNGSQQQYLAHFLPNFHGDFYSGHYSSNHRRPSSYPSPQFPEDSLLGPGPSYSTRQHPQQKTQGTEENQEKQQTY
ncbi:hypothetical protein Lal_00047159 [Lupinus albus]|nr:hypothetical protein Lal_00047159 [Lupinus albus]